MTTEDEKFGRKVIAVIALNSAWIAENFSFEEHGDWHSGLQIMDGEVVTGIYDFSVEMLTMYDLTPGPYEHDAEIAMYNREEVTLQEQAMELLDEDEYVRFDVLKCMLRWGYVESEAPDEDE